MPRQPLNCSIAAARRLSLSRQLLLKESAPPEGRTGVLEVIQKLGYVQIDTLSVVRRAHHHVLGTRLQAYSADDLHDLQSNDRAVFEYWGHAMSYLPMEDYRFYLPRMQAFRNPKSAWSKKRLAAGRHLFEPILNRIRAEGPLGSRDFEASARRKGGAWWDWKPAKIALEFLFWRGELMISKRRNFQKIYDLTERVLPAQVDTRLPETEEVRRFLVRRCLQANGMATLADLSSFLQAGASRDADLIVATKTEILNTVNEMVEEGEILEVRLPDLKDLPFFMEASAVDELEVPLPENLPVRILSPFDNLVIRRDRLSRLFGFDYTLECYVPAAKRKFGYFALPLLEGDRFFGRMDAKADRKKGEFQIHLLSLEPGIRLTDMLVQKTIRAIRSFARFNQCGRIILNNGPEAIQAEFP